MKLANVADQKFFIYGKQIKCRLNKKWSNDSKNMFVTSSILLLFLRLTPPGVGKNIQGEKG